MQATNFDKPILGKYQVRSKLKVGGFGSVYRARGVGDQSSHNYAVKVMPKKYQRYADVERELYQAIQKAEFTMGFVKQYDYGEVKDKICLVMELVGHDLEEIMFRVKSHKFSIKTTLMIGLQLIDRIEALHTIGYLHRDIKPDNLTIGINQNSTVIYLIDFGLSKKISSPTPQDEKNKIIGTLAYMSCRVHEGKDAGVLDDMESFVYTLVYLLTGTLPWMSIPVRDVTDYHRIKIAKEKLNQTWFVKNKIPIELYQVLDLVRNHNPKKKFDYLNIKYKLMHGLTTIGESNDFKFDWCKDPKEFSPAKVNEKKQEKKMKEENQKIVQNEIYEIYKFMDKEEHSKPKSPKKQEQPKAKKLKPEAPLKKQLAKEEPAKPRNPKPQVKRPNSSKNPRNAQTDYQRQLEQQLKLIESMRVDGPRIVINRTAAHKI